MIEVLADADDYEIVDTYKNFADPIAVKRMELNARRKAVDDFLMIAVNLEFGDKAV